jgi:hypothetical protein
LNAPAKLAAFLSFLVAVFGVAYLAGTQSAALLAPAPVHDPSRDFGGLSATDAGYRLQMAEPAGKPGDDQFIEFRITGPDGNPVPGYTEIDGAPMHLVAVRRDLTGFQHIFPQQGEGASWWAVLNLTPGPWRLIAEFQPTASGRNVVLGTDLTISGDYRPQPLPSASEQVEVDGFVATMSSPPSTAPNSQMVITITSDGQPVTDLASHHGSLGHAVILRRVDLGYLHPHADPVAESYHGPEIAFTGGVPEPGTYRIFVEFDQDHGQHDHSPSHVATFTSAVNE